MLKSLHLRNWCLHKNRVFEFKPGLNGILGGNGLGKTSVLSALAFALTGVSTTYGSKLDNLSWGEKSGYVELTFSIEDTEYSVRRAIEKSSVKLTTPDGDLTRSAEVEAKITELFGATPQVLLNNIFASQGEIDRILYQPPAARMKELQQTFGLGRQDLSFRALGMEYAGYKLTPGLKENFDSVSKEVVSCRSKVDQISSELAKLAARALELRPAQVLLAKAAEAEKHNYELATATRNEEAARERQTLSLAKLAGAQPASDLAGTRLVTLQAEHDEICDKIASVRHATTELEQLKPNLSKVNGLRQEYETLKLNDFSNIDALTADLRDSESDLNLQKQIQSGTVERVRIPAEVKARQELIETELALKTLQAPAHLIRELDTKMAELKQLHEYAKVFASGKCPTCGQSVESDHDHSSRLSDISRLTAETSALSTEISNSVTERTKELTGRLDGLKVFLTKCESAWATVQRSKTTAAQERKDKASQALQLVLGMRDRFNTTKQELERCETALSRVPQLMEAIKGTSIIDLNKSLADNSGQQEHCRKAMEVFRSAKQELTFISNEYVTTCALLKTLQSKSIDTVSLEEVDRAKLDIQELNAVETQQRELNLDLGTNKARLDILLIEARRLTEILKAEARDASWASVVQAARQVLHVTELPAALMREHGRRLNSRIQYYLQSWEAQFRMWLDEEMTFLCEFTDGRRHEASRLSGGQKIVASTSFRFAMADLFAKGTGVLVLDEPSTALDQANVVHLQKLLLKLKELTGRGDRQIILVTHEVSLMSFLENVIEL